MAFDTGQAQAFVAAQGTEIEQARLAALLGREPALPASFVALQRADGGFPYDWRADAPSSLHYTAQALQWLHDLGLNDEKSAAQAITFLVHAQKTRGIWREHDDLRRYDLPPWMDPDDTAADVYTTALCANALVPFGRGSLALDRALAWLQTQHGRDGLLSGFRVHASALAVPVFAELLGPDARATRRLVAGLGDALNDEWDTATLGLLLRSMLDAGYGLRTEVVARAWTMLQSRQRPDGSFAGEDDDTGSAATTLLVIQIAKTLGYEIAKL